MDKIKLAEITTDPEILDELSKDKDRRVRCYIAYNSNTSPETLDYLSRDKDSDVRLRVAQNPNTTPETLKQMVIVEDYLSKNEDWVGGIRYYVARNSNTSPETLDYLSKDGDSDVRFWVAWNRNTTPETLKQMAIDENHEAVKFYIKRNLNCSEETWRYLSALEILETLQ